MEREVVLPDMFVLWFDCPGCNEVVTGYATGSGPGSEGRMSRSHCCLSCEAQPGQHDPTWCARTPKSMFREASVPSCDERCHYLLHVPDLAEGHLPVPAVLWLHGGMTYMWPEEHWKDLDAFLSRNAVARNCVIVAPFATPALGRYVWQA